MLRLVLLMTALLCAVNASADCAPYDTETTVAQLLERVRGSDAIFLRNGREYDGQRAAEHIAGKYEHFRDRIVSVEDFIRLAATRSEISGKAYRVRLHDGSVVPSAHWLNSLLAELQPCQEQG